MHGLHIVQRKILFDLLFSDSLRYTDIKPLDMDSTQFMFHLKQLKSKGFVVKNPSGVYKLTEVGKEFANKLDITSLTFFPQTKVTTVFCCVRLNGKHTEYLLYQRLKNPYYECYGFPTQKVLWGETIESAAVKGLYEETGLKPSSTLTPFAIRHYRVYDKDKVLLEDKLMHGFIIPDPIGDLISNIEGDFFWADDAKIKTLSKTQDEFSEFLITLKGFIKNNTMSFKEFDVVSTVF